MSAPFRAGCGLLMFLAVTGCEGSAATGEADVLQHPRLEVLPEVLDRYAGTYELASGAHFTVVHENGRLLAGTPPSELLPKTTRAFTSNRLPGSFHFETTDSNQAIQLRREIGDLEFICPAIDTTKIADPAKLVDAGGHSVRMLVTGSGSPTIVLEDGFGSGIEIQAELQADLSKLSTVVSSDHAGTGGSDTGPAPRDGRRVIGELRRALRSAGAQPPFLLIGSSIGGDYIRIFASEFPEDTAGLILLDPAPDWDALHDWALKHSPNRASTYETLARTAGSVMDQMMSVQEPGRLGEWESLAITRSQARETVVRADIPVVQISGVICRSVTPIMDDKVRFFDAWLAANVPHAKHVPAPNSGHAVYLGDRDLVLTEVKAMLRRIRDKQ